MNPTHQANQPQVPLTRIPEGIHCARDYEFLARHFIAGSHYEYIAGGSGEGVTEVANRAALHDLTVCPRVLNDVSAGHARVELFGRVFPAPILLAPVAFQLLAHPRGELETARAATALSTCLIVSTLASVGLEEIAGTGPGERWFQLYFQPSRASTLNLLKRAEVAGYAAIVVTLDTAIQAPSLRALRAGFAMPSQCAPVNLQGYPLPEPVTLAPGQSVILQGMMREAPTWADLAWLLEHTHLPILVKGILHPDDAVRLKSMGVAGLIVSNHGGRTLDHAPASLHALPAVRATLGDDYPVLFDGGIRSGTDVFKAIALGADAVLLGRLQVYALSVAGALGVAHMLKLVREELEMTMALTGCATLADVRKAVVRPKQPQ